MPTKNLGIIEQHMRVAVIRQAPALAFRQRVRIPEHGQERLGVDLLGDALGDVDDRAIMRESAEQAVPVVDDVIDVRAGLHVERRLFKDLVVRHRDDVDLAARRLFESLRDNASAHDMRLDHHEIERHAREVWGGARAPRIETGGRARRNAPSEKPSPRQRTGRSGS